MYYIERQGNSRVQPTQNKKKKVFLSPYNFISLQTEFWFINQVHQAFMIITALLTVTGVAFAFIYVGHWSEVITTILCNLTITNYHRLHLPVTSPAQNMFSRDVKRLSFRCQTLKFLPPKCEVLLLDTAQR